MSTAIVCAARYTKLPLIKNMPESISIDIALFWNVPDIRVAEKALASSVNIRSPATNVESPFTPASITLTINVNGSIAVAGIASLTVALTPEVSPAIILP